MVATRCGRGYPAVFDDVPKSYRLELVSSTESSNGIVRLRLLPKVQGTDWKHTNHNGAKRKWGCVV